MDIATIIGILLGFGAIIGGQVLEGGHVSALVQPTAAVIILGGTLGATFVSFPMEQIIQALKDIRKAFIPSSNDPEAVIRDMIGYAAKARKNGLISLEQESQNISDQFTKKGLSLVVDGIDPQKLRETLEVELATFEEHNKVSAEVFEAAGGYSPTIGIIGAVLGLIHVMNNLSDSANLGKGIAVAFVATIYGLMVANLVCLPIATKLKMRLKEQMQRMEMVIEGLISIQNGENPHFIEQKLRSFMGSGHEVKPVEKKAKP
jgi:chemotaxis protein MotA